MKVNTGGWKQVETQAELAPGALMVILNAHPRTCRMKGWPALNGPAKQRKTNG